MQPPVPDQTPFERFIAPARARSQLWRLLLGLVLITYIYLGTFALMTAAAYLVAAPQIGTLGFLGWVQGLMAPVAVAQTLFILLSFLGMFLGVVLAATTCHFRSPGTLFGPARPVLRNFALTALILAPIYAAIFAFAFTLEPPVPNLLLADWLRLLPLALPLLLLQVTAEELVFRGYLPQQLAARFSLKWVWRLLPALLFALLHWNPAAGANAPLILVATFVFAFAAMDLTERTGNLGAAIGLHFMNNFSALLLIAVQDTITGLALFTTPFAANDTGSLPMLIIVDIAALLIIWTLLRRLLPR